MKTCKKLFSLLLVAVMLVAAIPTFAFAASMSTLYVNVDGASKGSYPLTSFTTAETARKTYDSSDPECATVASDLLTDAGLGATYPATDFEVVQAVVDPTTGDASVSLKTKTPAAVAKKNFTVQVRIGADKSTAQNGKTGTYNADATLANPDVNSETKAFAILDAAVPGAYPQTVYKFEAASVQGDTIYIRVSEKHQHNYTLVPNSGDATGHEIKCSCGDVQKVSHAGEHYVEENKKDPTCTAKGWTGDKKYDCGYIESGTEVPALNHDFKNGTCTRCGEADPSATAPAPAPAPASYSKVVVVYCDENGKAKTDGVKTIILTAAYTGSTTDNDAQNILKHAGITEDMNKYTSPKVAVSGDTITVTLTDKADTRYVLNLTVVTGTTTTTKTYRVAYTGNVDTMSVLKGFGVDKDFNLDNYTYSNFGYDNAKTFTLTMTAKPTAADKYTVNCVVNGTQFASKTDVTYVGSFESNITNAQAILNAAGIQKTASEYKKVTITKSNTNVITVDLRNTVVVRVYNNANSYSEVTMDVGQPYVNYLGTNLINNSTFGGITVKDTSDRNTYYSASQVNGRTALVSAFDKEITIQRNGDSCTLYFLRSDGTVLESRKLYAGDQIGTLPSYIVGNVPATWTYNGKPISATDVYNFKTTSVNIVPYFGGISDVYVDVYTNGNVKTMQTRVKVTDLVQNGVLYLNSEVKSAISSALRNTSNKNLTYTAFFDASTWSDFIKTKNTNGAAEPIRVGDNSERQGSVYLYVMVNNVTQKATDSTNPKTGDDVKLGVAAAVLAVAVVGFGAAIVIKKKKGVQ